MCATLSAIFREYVAVSWFAHQGALFYQCRHRWLNLASQHPSRTHRNLHIYDDLCKNNATLSCRRVTIAGDVDVVGS